MKAILFAVLVFVALVNAAVVRKTEKKTDDTAKPKRHIDFNQYNGFSGHHGYQYSVPSSVVSNTHEYRQITQKVQVPVPQPYPVTITKTVPVPQPYPVEVPKPYAVPYEVQVPYEVPKPYEVKVPHPVPVEVKVPYPVEVPKPYPVEVTRHVEVPVEKKVIVKVPVRVPEPVPQPYPVHITTHEEVRVPTPIYIKERKYVHTYSAPPQVPCDDDKIHHIHTDVQYGNQYGHGLQNGQYGNQYGLESTHYGQGLENGQYGSQYGYGFRQANQRSLDLSSAFSNNYESHQGYKQGQDDYSGLLKSYVPSSQGGYQ